MVSVSFAVGSADGDADELIGAVLEASCTLAADSAEVLAIAMAVGVRVMFSVTPSRIGMIWFVPSVLIMLLMYPGLQVNFCAVLF